MYVSRWESLNLRLEQNCCSDDGCAAFVDTSEIVSFGDLFDPDRLHFNEEGSRRLGMSIAPLFLPALLDHRGAWSLPDAGEAGPMLQCFSAPALSEKEVLAYGDSLTAGFYMAGHRFSSYGEALRQGARRRGRVSVWLERADYRSCPRTWMLGSSWLWHADTVRDLARFLRNGGPSTWCSSRRE